MPESKFQPLFSYIEYPADERPFPLLVTGFPAEDAQVLVIQKKLQAEIATFI